MIVISKPVSCFLSKVKGIIYRYGLDLELLRERKGQRENCLKAWEVGREQGRKLLGCLAF
jgi:hypothetical protein